MRKFGLIGKSLKHTFSPGYFQNKFLAENIENCVYDAYELVQIEDLNELLSRGMEGLNVTIPYKELVLPYLDVLSPAASAIKAVNTIKIHDNCLYGFNTDFLGFSESLKGHDFPIKHALILGTGGASKAIHYALQIMGFKTTSVSSSGKGLAYERLDKKILQSVDLIVNTTPVGMYPNIDKTLDFPFEYISSQHFVYDLIYNPEKTLFLKWSEDNGARIKNGYEMLVLQAEASWRIWNTSLDHITSEF